MNEKKSDTMRQPHDPPPQHSGVDSLAEMFRQLSEIPVARDILKALTAEATKPRVSVTALAQSFAEWEGVEVFVQLRPGIRCQLTKLVADRTGEEGIEAATMEGKDEQGNRTVGLMASPFLVGRLRVVGAMLELTYRQTEDIRASIALHPKDVQHVTRIERTLIRTQ